MAYIGNQPFTTAFLTDQFSGTGSQTAFTLSAAPANTNSLLVAVTGVLQDPSTYSVAGTTLTFSAAPPSGTANISVRFLGIPASGVTTTAYRTLTEFTATAGQTTFTPPSYTVGYINVFRNGVMLGTADYTASNGTTVVLASAASAGDLVVTESFYVSSVLNAIPGTAGSVGTTYLVDGSVTPAKLSTGGLYWDTSSNVGIGTSSPTPPFANYRTVALNGSSGSAIQMQYGGSLASNIVADSNALYLQNITAVAFGTGGTGTGTERMRIDSSGRVTTPYQPAFYAYGFTAGNYSGSQLIPFNSVQFNRGSGFNTGTSRFTAPVSGVYCFQTGIYVYSGSAGSNQSFVWRLNGTELALSGDATIFFSGAMSGGPDNMTIGSILFSLSAGDYITLNVRTGSPTVSLYPGHSFFCGYLVG